MSGPDANRPRHGAPGVKGAPEGAPLPGSFGARLARNSVFVLFARATDLLVALISTALIARYLGVADFGDFAFVMAITIFLIPLTDFGFERILTREIAADPGAAEKYFGSAVASRLLLSAFVVAAILLLTYFSGWDQRVVLAIYVSTFAQLFSSMGSLAIGAFRAFERMSYELVLNFFFNLLYLALLVAVIWTDAGFLMLFGARLLASFVHMCALGAVSSKRFVRLSLSFDPRLMKYLFLEALPLGIFAFLLTASFRVDVFVLKYFKGAFDVSLFDAAHRVIMQLQAFPTAIAIAIFPHFSRLAAEDGDALKDAFSRTFKFMLIASLPISVLLIYASDRIVSILYAESFVSASGSLKVMALTVTFLFLISIQSFAIVAKGRQVLNTVSALICFIVNLLIAVFIVPISGFMGASYATLIAYAVFFVISFYFSARVVGMPPIIKIAPRPLLSLGVMALLSLFIYNGDSVILTALACAALFLAYVAMIILTKALTREEVLAIMGLFSKRRLKERA